MTHTGGDHTDGRMVDHADDGDGHTDPLSEHVKKHEETHDGNKETPGAEKWCRLNSTGGFILVVVHGRYRQANLMPQSLTFVLSRVLLYSFSLVSWCIVLLHAAFLRNKV